MEPEVFLTADGSHSLRSPRFHAAYHSTHGAVNESRHVFIEAGLLPALDAGDGGPVRVLEMGLGTGLNVLLTWAVAGTRPVDYVAYEAFPLDIGRAEQLNYPEQLGIPRELFLGMHRQPWDQIRRIGDHFTFCKHRADFLSAPPEASFDVIYYDAFAPEQQPELWTVAAMQHCRRWLRAGGRLVTYCAKGQFKRNLREAGFRVEALPGPVGKREITRAHLVDLS